MFLILHDNSSFTKETLIEHVWLTRKGCFTKGTLIEYTCMDFCDDNFDTIVQE